MPDPKKKKTNELPEVLIPGSPEYGSAMKAYEDSLYSYEQGEALTVELGKILDEIYKRDTRYVEDADNSYARRYKRHLDIERGTAGTGPRDYYDPNDPGYFQYADVIPYAEGAEFMDERQKELREWAAHDSDSAERPWYGERADALEVIKNLPVKPEKFIMAPESPMIPVYRKPIKPKTMAIPKMEVEEKPQWLEERQMFDRIKQFKKPEEGKNKSTAKLQGNPNVTWGTGGRGDKAEEEQPEEQPEEQSSDWTTKLIRGVLEPFTPENTQQFLAASVTGDSKYSKEDAEDDMAANLYDAMNNARKRTGSNEGGTQYRDYNSGSALEEDINHLNVSTPNMIYGSMRSPEFKAATTWGRVSYRYDPVRRGYHVYDRYDFSSTEKEGDAYADIRKVAGTTIPEKDGEANYVGFFGDDDYKDTERGTTYEEVKEKTQEWEDKATEWKQDLQELYDGAMNYLQQYL